MSDDVEDAVATAELISDTLTKYIHMFSPWISTMRYEAPRTIEDVEKDLIELRKDSDTAADYEQLSHEVSSLQYLLMCLMRDMAATQAQVHALETSNLRDSDEKAVTLVAFRARLESYKNDINTLNSKYDALLLELKEKRFFLASDKLRKEKLDLEEQAQLLADLDKGEEPKSIEGSSE